MKYQRPNTGVSGVWVRANELKNGMKAKIVSETTPQPSQFTDKKGNPKTQDVCKIRIQGQSEPVNASLNRATISGLIDAFGDDSVNWQNQILTVETEKVRVGGKIVTALYLIPDGYVKQDDENGYAIIIKKEIAQMATPNPDMEMSPDDKALLDNLPF